MAGVCHECHDKLYDKNKSLEAKLQEKENDYQAMRQYRANHFLKREEAEAKLQIAIEALEFYGNKENYHTSGYGMKWFAEHGYKRAKLALEKIGGTK